MPLVGRQDTNKLCISDSFAFALQTVITAKHAITNNLTSPLVVSSQYFLDCRSDSGCTAQYTRKELYESASPSNRLLPLVGQYPRAETGVRGACAAVSLSSVSQQANSPKIIDYFTVDEKDAALEKEVRSGPVLAKIYIPKNILQFYTAGVVSYDMCYNGTGDIYYNTAITGFTRVGQNGSGPFWQVRGSFGTNWGINGLMWIEKRNDSTGEWGPCQIHRYAVELVAKKY